eukprot:TRINITY_DN1085_c0_g2_i9.p1 TRINITY_DN1085_c0_g2~~TRINITY_DN1085_c0_g2_i9.p1  ORF type:complete len:247 (-),score=30.91 TRINITY_DN1085_c0_g2_i9:487-1227(-)
MYKFDVGAQLREKAMLWVYHTVVSIFVCSVLVYALRNFIYSYVLLPCAKALHLEPSNDPGIDSRDKFMFGSWCLIIHSIGLALMLFFLHERGELFGLFFPWSHNDSSIYIPTHSDLNIGQSKVWIISLEIGFYLVELFYVVKEAPPDRTEKIAHHITALYLILTCFFHGIQTIGIYVMVMHKVIEPMLFGAKAAHYAGASVLSNVLFALFLITWIPTRLVVFPYWAYYKFLPGLLSSIFRRLQISF